MQAERGGFADNLKTPGIRHRRALGAFSQKKEGEGDYCTVRRGRS